VPVDDNGNRLKCHHLGIDPESLARDEFGHFWVGEEYGPSIFQFSENGTLLKIYAPEGYPTLDKKALQHNVFPAFVTKRKVNRGFEAIAIRNHLLYAMLQSPLPKDATKRSESTIPIFIIDLTTHSLKTTLWYPLDSIDLDLKIGDITFQDEDHLLVVEQNSEVGVQSFHKIYQVNIKKALSSSFNTDNGPLDKRLVIDLVKAGYHQFAKIEGITYVPNIGIALLNDNDFGVNEKNQKSNSSVLGIFTDATNL
jgi:hypothetical protein